MAKNPIVEHNRDDALYVDECTRICPDCEQAKPLAAFQDAKTLRRSELKVYVQCSTCARRDCGMELARSADTLAAALKKATGRRLLEEAAPSSVDALKSILEKMGGQNVAFGKVGEALDAGLSSPKIDTRIKAASALMSMSTTVERMQGDPIDAAQLTDEDRMMVLREPARELILTDADLRRQLLNDPEIRAALLAEAGVTVIEGDSEQCHE
jgi:hypothetical protein